MNIEQQFINTLIKGHKRSPLQLNQIHESDAELIQISPDGPILAITTDCLVEEMAHSLYTDPFLIGWMSVICNASDLAAVGATPLGIMISSTFTENYTLIDQIQMGIKEACDSSALPLLGGDTNFSTQLSLTGTAIGFIQKGKPLTRKGCHSGDILASSGPLGAGNLFAYQKLFCNESLITPQFQPKARFKEGELLRSFATSCIDTSDGLFSALEDMMGVNPVGFKISSDHDSNILTEIHETKFPFPPWLFLAGHHGEYELVFTIPSNQWNHFMQESKQIGWSPLKLGTVVESPGIYLNELFIKPGMTRRTWNDAKGNLSLYFNHLLDLGES